MAYHITPKRVRLDDLYNEPSLIYLVKNGEHMIERYQSLVCVSIDWGGGYPMPGIKLGKARDSPYYRQEEVNKKGLYTEHEFNKLWKCGSIKVLNSDMIEYISH